MLVLFLSFVFLFFNVNADMICFENRSGGILELQLQRGGRLLYKEVCDGFDAKDEELRDEKPRIVLRDNEQYLCWIKRDKHQSLGICGFFINDESEIVNIFDRSLLDSKIYVGNFVIEWITVSCVNPPEGQARYADRVYRITKRKGGRKPTENVN